MMNLRLSKMLFAILVALASIAATSARAGEIYTLIDPSTLTATASTTSGNGSGSRKPQYAVNGAGMNADGTHASDAANNKMWEAAGLSSPAWFRVDLGRRVLLNGIMFWNFNWSGYTNRGAKDIEIYYTDNETTATSLGSTPIDFIRNNWTALKTDYVLPEATGKATYAGDDMLTFGDVGARWVVFVITSSHGGNGGLSEARFYEHVVDAVLGDVELERTGPSTYSVSATEALNEADLYWIADDGASVTTNLIKAAVAEGETVTGTISDLPSGKTYQISVLAENAGGSDEKVVGTLYTGELSLGATTDANENGPVAGTVAVSRTSDDPWPLTVNYSISSSADGAAEGTTWAVPGAIMIPANERTGYLLVTPLLDPDVSTDIEVSVALAAGNYEIPAANEATLAIVNLVAPSDFNTWISSSNSLASIDCNWSAGHSPTASENVLFDGRFSTADCEWDAAATTTVASWTQTNDYTGVITLNTVYPGKGDFQCLTVTGDMMIDSGTITHPLSLNSTSKTWLTGTQIREQEVYRLCLAVGGTLSVGASGAIDVKDKGHYQKLSSNCYGTHAVGYSALGGAAAYGNPKEPIDVGMGCNGNQYAWVSYPGSGAIRITAENVVVNGSICADAGSVNYGGHRRFTAAAGSIWIDADSISGSGSITAVAVKPGSDSGNNGRGSGGSIALWTKTPVALGTPFVSAGATASGLNAPGTVFLHDQTMDKGVLVIDGMRSGNPLDYRACVNVTTDGDWTFDEVRLQNYGALAVPVGTTLVLPGGWASITSTNAVSAANYGVLRYEGGTIDVGTAANVVLSGRWMLTPWSNLVVNANVTVKGGAAIGVPAMADIVDSGSSLPTFVSCNLTVNGNLTVESDGSLVAKQCGLKKDKNSLNNGLSGVLEGHTHGGRCLAYKYKGAQFYTGYDSVFAPCLPGNSVPWPNGQAAEASGGVISLVVSGALTLDGEANVNGRLETYAAGGNCSGGTGGSIDITAGTLTGSGKILAEAGSKQAVRGSAGRIAVKLTKNGADFSNFTGTISASGRVLSSPGSSADSSAGTIYLQTAADGEKGGTVYIKMSEGNRYANNSNTTEMVSLGYGGDAVKDYKKVNYVVSDYGRAAVNTNIVVASVKIADNNSFLDLEGNALRTKSFGYPKIVGEETVVTKLAPGSYTAAELVERGIECVLDSSEGKTGVLDVGGIGFTLSVR